MSGSVSLQSDQGIDIITTYGLFGMDFNSEANKVRSQTAIAKTDCILVSLDYPSYAEQMWQLVH
jgi:hypothetical protein